MSSVSDTIWAQSLAAGLTGADGFAFRVIETAHFNSNAKLCFDRKHAIFRYCTTAVEAHRLPDVRIGMLRIPR